MSKGIYKILAGLVALFLGIGVAWASNLFRIAFYPFENSALSEKVPPIGSVGEPSSEEFGKLVIRFKGFELHKDWAAKFEIVNFSGNAVTYIGRETTDEYGLCTIAAQRDAIYDQRE